MIRIKDIEIYHPKKKVGNAKYLNKKDEKQRYFLEDILGKEERYEMAEDETVLDLMEEASKKILKKNNFTGNEIDLLVVGTSTPEYLVPPTSVMLHHRLGLKIQSISYDVNVCCLSMSFLAYQVYTLMKINKNIKKALIVSSDIHRPFLKENSAMYGLCGDLACAMILEADALFEDFIIDNYFCTYSKDCNEILLPIHELSTLVKHNQFEDFYSEFNANIDIHLDSVIEYIPCMLEKNNLRIEDISMFCLSQFVLRNIEILREQLGIPEEKSLYVGDQYGYTSGNSPFLALYEAIRQGKVKRGDYIFLWTVGAGLQHIYLLIKY